MTRTFAEELAALDADAFDVYQPDVVLAAGMLRTRTVAEVALARNRWFTPHTWTNGLGLLANLHVAAGVGGGPFIEVPYDPPGWTPERRDAFLAEPIRPDADGVLRVPCAPRAGRGHRRGRGGAVRGMSPAPTVTLADWLERAAAVRPRNELFIDGAFVAGRLGQDLRRHRRPRRLGHHRRRRGRAGGRRPRRRRRPPRVRRPPLVRPVARGPQAGAAAAGRPDPVEPRRARAARVARRRQADPGHAVGRRPVVRQDHPVVRRDHRQGLRRGRPDRARDAVAGDPRADRRGRRDRAVELPADHHRLEARRGARDRQQRGPQAGLAVAAERAAPGRAGRSRPGCRTAC